MSRPYTQIAKKHIFNSQNWLEQPDGCGIFFGIFQKVCSHLQNSDRRRWQIPKQILILYSTFHLFLNFRFRFRHHSYHLERLNYVDQNLYSWSKHFWLKNDGEKWSRLFYLKSYVPHQSCYCPVQKNLPRKTEMAWQVSRYFWRGVWNFFLNHFSPSFFSQKNNFKS